MKQNGQFRNAETLHKELTGATVAFTEPVFAQNGRIAANCYRKHSIRCRGRRNCHASPEKTGAGTWITLWARKSDRKINKDKVNATITRAISLTVPGKTPKDAVQYKNNIDLATFRCTSK